jgi:hypothetical protein
MKFPDIDKVLPDPKGPNAVPPPVNPKIQIEQMKLQAQQASDQLDMKMGLMKLMGDAELNQAKIQKLEAEAEAIKIGLVAEGEQMRLNQINTEIAMQRERREGVLSAVKTMNDVYATMQKAQLDRKLAEDKPPAS